jgi:hypothetical protein
MARIGRSWSFSICAVLALSYATVSAAQSGQQIPALFNIFGGLISTAIVDAARRDWQARPLSDYNCLARHGVSAEQLARGGIGPDDPRVRQYFSECASAAPAAPAAPVPVPVAPQPATGAVAGPASSKYVVNGLTLGASFSPQADAATGYACRASEDFPGFAWCQSHHAESRKFGSETTWMSVFRSEAKAAVEITQTVEPAFFPQGDAEREIQRLSLDFAQQARVVGADLPSGGHAVIAAWGAVTLASVAPPVLDALRRGGPVHSGLLVSALADPRAAARLGLPVYSLGGGAGFIWCANYNSSGKGVLRIIAVDPGALKSAPPSQTVASAPSPVVAVYAAPEPPAAPTPILDSKARRVEKVPVAAPPEAPSSAASPALSGTIASQAQEPKVEQPPPGSLPSSPSPTSPPSNRVALVVANGAYSEAPLANPTVDADIVAGSLEKIGFSVMVRKDLDLDRFEQAIQEFSETTRGADIALFYFAGHGFSVDLRGRQENLLMATSANFSAKTALALEGGGEPLDHVEETIIGRARATLIFIDACRNIPALASRSVGSRGFAPVDTSNLAGVYVVLSTRVGQTAEDGARGQGSPFARAFASVMPTPGLRIEDAYSRMREQVRRDTAGGQVPDSIRSDLPEGGVVLVGSNVK